MVKPAEYNYNQCRSLGHAWEQIPTTRRPSWGQLVTYRCLRCTTTREDTLDWNFRLSTRSYHHPDDCKTDARKRYEWIEAMLSDAAVRQLVETGAKGDKPDKIERVDV